MFLAKRFSANTWRSKRLGMEGSTEFKNSKFWFKTAWKRLNCSSAIIISVNLFTISRICIQSTEFVYNQHNLYTISKICKQSAEICIQSAEFIYNQQKLFPTQLGSCSIIQAKKIAAEAPSNFYKSLQIREKRFFPEQEYTLLLYLLELTFVFQRKKWKMFLQFANLLQHSFPPQTFTTRRKKHIYRPMQWPDDLWIVHQWSW